MSSPSSVTAPKALPPLKQYHNGLKALHEDFEWIEWLRLHMEVDVPDEDCDALVQLAFLPVKGLEKEGELLWMNIKKEDDLRKQFLKVGQLPMAQQRVQADLVQEFNIRLRRLFNIVYTLFNLQMLDAQPPFGCQNLDLGHESASQILLELRGDVFQAFEPVHSSYSRSGLSWSAFKEACVRVLNRRTLATRDHAMMLGERETKMCFTSAVRMATLNAADRGRYIEERIFCTGVPCRCQKRLQWCLAIASYVELIRDALVDEKGLAFLEWDLAPALRHRRHAQHSVANRFPQLDGNIGLRARHYYHKSHGDVKAGFLDS